MASSPHRDRRARVVGLAGPTHHASPCDSETVVPHDEPQTRADCEALWEFYTQLDDRGNFDDPGPGVWGPDTPLSRWFGSYIRDGVNALSVTVTDAGGTTFTDTATVHRLSDLSYGFETEVLWLLNRALNLPPATHDHFDDGNDSLLEDDINRLAEAGIVQGCATDSYCPAGDITRPGGSHIHLPGGQPPLNRLLADHVV